MAPGASSEVLAFIQLGTLHTKHSSQRCLLPQQLLLPPATWSVRTCIFPMLVAALESGVAVVNACQNTQLTSNIA